MLTAISAFAYYESMVSFGGAGRQDKKLRILLVAAGVLIIVLAALAGFLFWKYHGSNQEDDQSKSNRIISQVGELFILPKGETPTVAAIQDLSKLKGQEFFSDAKNGDYVLIYSQAKVAFLYREPEGKLVNVGPIKTENNAANQTQNTQQ